MVIDSRTIVGVGGAFALVGALLWGSAALVSASESDANSASVEVKQIQESAWAVEVKELGALEKTGEAKLAAR